MLAKMKLLCPIIEPIINRIKTHSNGFLHLLVISKILGEDRKIQLPDPMGVNAALKEFEFR